MRRAFVLGIAGCVTTTSPSSGHWGFEVAGISVPSRSGRRPRPAWCSRAGMAAAATSPARGRTSTTTTGTYRWPQQLPRIRRRPRQVVRQRHLSTAGGTSIPSRRDALIRHLATVRRLVDGSATRRGEGSHVGAILYYPSRRAGSASRTASRRRPRLERSTARPCSGRPAPRAIVKGRRDRGQVGGNRTVARTRSSRSSEAARGRAGPGPADELSWGNGARPRSARPAQAGAVGPRPEQRPLPKPGSVRQASIDTEHGAVSANSRRLRRALAAVCGRRQHARRIRVEDGQAFPIDCR